MKTARLWGTAALAAIVAAQPVLAQMTEIGAGEGRLDIVAWPGYIERGETDKNFDWVTEVRGSRPAARSTSRPPAPPTRWSR